MKDKNWNEGLCPNDDTPCVFDPDLVGETVGGLMRTGWNRCPKCGGIWLAKQGREGGGPWKLTNSGRSLEADGVRLRAEKKGAADRVPELMRRIARLPELERALREIAEIAAKLTDDEAGALDRIDKLASAALKAEAES